MASIFPNSPELNSVFTSNGTTWQWNGEAWTVVASDGQTFTSVITSPSSQTISADSPTDTLTIAAGTNISVSANSSNDSITIGVTGIQEQIDNLITSIGPSSASATASRITAYVKNGSTSLSKGVPVYVTGADGTNIIIGPASNASESTSSKTLGFTQTALSANQHGYIVLEGTLSGLDTSLSGSAGDPIWLGETPGTVIYGLANKPQAPNHLVYLGVVSRKNSSNGEIFVKIQNGFELKELHDVRITNIQNNDIILWNSASSIWVNSVLPVSLPNQTGNNGKYLTTNGASASWATLDLNSAINTASAAAVNYLVDSAPGTLDTLNELSAALNDDPNFYSTIQAVYLTQSNASATYATISDANTSISRWSKIYSASATVISGVDDDANNLDYTFGYTTLFINGILQDPSNYTASSGSTIVLNDAVLINDVVEVLSYKTFNVANTYTTSEIDSKVSNYTRWVKTLSGSATVISGVDDNSLSLLYTIGNEEVYVNGILLKEVTDYATTSASSITLSEVALSGDTVEVINFTTINLASVYTKTESDNKYEPNIAYVSSSPSAPTAGTLWIDSTNSAAPALKVYNGSTWIAVSGSSEAGLHPFFQAGI